MSGKREYGDYQTPIEFSERVCRYIKDYRHIEPTAVIEPTCGQGSFLKSSLIFDADEYYGIEINPAYCEQCQSEITDKRVKVINSDIFSFSTKSLVQNQNQVLIIGNPPWVTNSALSVFGSDNLPKKMNFKGLKGIDAITGTGNFDICEYIILQLIHEYRETNAVISMLCKTSVARNIFKEIKRNNICFSAFDMLEFDAAKVFGIHAAACVLIIQLSSKEETRDSCNVFDFDAPEILKSQFGYSDSNFYSNLDAHVCDFDGFCCFEWRQGVKHDCSKVMELTMSNGLLQNGHKETVSIEDDIVFPLVKSSMFKAPVIHEFTKFVIVTQKKAREETEHLKTEAPKAWAYLNDNIAFFKNRKSSIYREAPPFSMFGVGDYSYAKYKVAVSGFYKRPLFSLLYSNDEKPVMTDDTSYFICFDNYDMAYMAMLILNSEKVQDFLTGIAFLDAKRPYTKKILERIDFDKIVEKLSLGELRDTEDRLCLSSYVTPQMYNAFKGMLKIGQMRFA